VSLADCHAVGVARDREGASANLDVNLLLDPSGVKPT
jgi:hypothetical protein